MQQPSTSNRLRPFRPTSFGRYTLLMPISMGGMGEIFLARLDGAQGFEKLCVIKKILPHLAEDQDFVARFHNEARTLVKLTHGAIAQVLDMGQFQREPYLALEYIDGKDLRKVGARFRERGMPMPLTFVLYVMGRVLDALAYAHRKRDDEDREIGLVHRDMSPQNVLISYEGEVKVIDFGLAKSTLNASKTNPSIVLGKFLYMSPEQARHAKVDRRSDLYSVGICLYELIAGRNPFEDVPPHALMAAVASPNIAHIQTIEPLCPTNVAQVIMKSLASDPAQRFQTAEELRGRLLGCLLEIDPSAGPESCSRFMRDIFAAEYQAERKLLAQFKEAVRSESATIEVVAPRPGQVRPLNVGRSNPRLEIPPVEESTPSPTDLRTYGLEPTLPHAQSPLSFAPTPKLVGASLSKAHEGERETVPGVIVDHSTGTLRNATGDDDERVTGPHPILSPGARPSEDGPTWPVPQVKSGPSMVHARHGSDATTVPAVEPITSEVPVALPPEERLPSVMVSGLAAAPAPKPPPGKVITGKMTTGGVLVPASTVRPPAVVAPLPKALEGKKRPDENLVTDRGTRSRRSGAWVVLLPVLAFLGLASFVGYSVFKEQTQTEFEEGGAKGSLLKPSLDDQKRRKLGQGGPVEPSETEEETVEGVPSGAPESLPAAAAQVQDVPEPLPVKTAPAARVYPKTPAGEKLKALQGHLDAAVRDQVLMEEKRVALQTKINALELKVQSLPAGGPAVRRFLAEVQDTEELLNAALGRRR